MKCSSSPQELIDGLWRIAAQHTTFHPYDRKRKAALVGFLTALERLDSETYLDTLRFVRQHKNTMTPLGGDRRAKGTFVRKLRELVEVL